MDKLKNPTNVKGGYEAVNERPDGEPQLKYDQRMAKLRETFGVTLKEQRRIAIREAIASAAIHAPKQVPPA
jgi:hypothetical protein